MPNTDKNKAGGHSHPQKDNKSNNDQGDSRKGKGSEQESGKKGDGPKESFGSSGAKDNH